MTDAVHVAERLAYVIIALGTILAVAAAITPWYTGAYKLYADILIFGLLPYLAYASLSRTLSAYPLMLAGLALLSVDILARAVVDFSDGSRPDVMMAIWLCLALLLVVMPAGAILGWLISRWRG